MQIEIWIDYWAEGVLTFNPEKVVSQLRKFFPQAEIDWKDQSRLWFEKFFQNVKERGLNPPDVMIESKWDLLRQGPTFKFKILTEKNIEIDGLSDRYRVELESEQEIDSEIEKTIIDFLKSLKYGEIRSNTQTECFCKPSETFEGRWLLEESI